MCFTRISSSNAFCSFSSNVSIWFNLTGKIDEGEITGRIWWYGGPDWEEIENELDGRGRDGDVRMSDVDGDDDDDESERADDDWYGRILVDVWDDDE